MPATSSGPAGESEIWWGYPTIRTSPDINLFQRPGLSYPSVEHAFTQYQGKFSADFADT